ncbi:MAG: NADH-quinone oxidoreductase subunit C [Gammaproteobacteria bacterium]|nr:NADH-quinone oxidoreductase subunit C [Gammaproteobacteria bacterium]
MTLSPESLAVRLQERFSVDGVRCVEAVGEVTMDVPAAKLLPVCQALRDEAEFAFEQLIDLCGVDYSAYGVGEWQTSDGATSSGFSRGVAPGTPGPDGGQERRFAVVYHLLSVSNNLRVRVQCYAQDEPPRVSSVVEVWNSANWFEREAFDLFGILFEGHPDMRRILTDYGFVGHPFRKDFPLIGHVEMRYDPEKQRVVYEPVSIEPRTLVPRVLRDDSRYVEAEQDEAKDDA